MYETINRRIKRDSVNYCMLHLCYYSAVRHLYIDRAHSLRLTLGQNENNLRAIYCCAINCRPISCSSVTIVHAHVTKPMV